MNEVKNPKVRKPLIYYYMMALLIMLLLNTFLFPALLGRKEVEVDYSTFTTQLAQGNIQQVEVLDQKIEYLLNDAGVEAGECLFIDDGQKNIDRANSMGFQTRHVQQGESLDFLLEL